jgi:GNAT superfamily N-acetyltransferase
LIAPPSASHSKLRGMPPANGRYIVSTAPGRLDMDFVCAALAGTYWAKGRPRAVIRKSVRSSLCFGVYERRGGRQVAFARVVTDRATFSWICDVVVDEGERGRGIGKLLMASVAGHPHVRRWLNILGTRDAHGLYEKFGFAREELMTRRPARKG